MTTRSLLYAILAISLMAGTLTGCGFKDIDKRFFVVAMGIDLSETNKKDYYITLRLAAPSPRVEPGASKTDVQAIHAPSIAEALRLLKSYVDKEIDFGHCKLYVFGEKLVQSDYRDVMDWLSRRRDVQNVSYLAIGRPDAQSIMKINPPTERYPGNTLFLQFGKDGTESSYIISEYLFDFMRRLGEKGMDPILPVVQTVNNGYLIAQLALLNKRNMVETLSQSETQLFNQIFNKFTKSTITATIKDERLVLAVNRITSHYKIVKGTNGTHTLKLTLGFRGIFEEAPQGIYNRNWTDLQNHFNRQIAGEAKQLLEKVQKADVDPFGFGLRFRATHKGSETTWKEWQSIYPRLTFDVKVDTMIEGTGVIR
ncbi:Ger(x)C family spore germination protein [Paenibacillus nasutitermitis]|uniref:Ger(X)C family spore germination protein n=1 Tax=Paenibacillus nasutitermitis TaxID=1652958 RepID=A0A916Z3H5_9BACL|nr:Ger(x)C family spore germination protein [Paenibacillus nasutitermitis]GGD73978.1 hypothetical protein GCM10010911_34850 [Paenibacillus nasutitermitis]